MSGETFRAIITDIFAAGCKTEDEAMKYIEERQKQALAINPKEPYIVRTFFIKTDDKKSDVVKGLVKANADKSFKKVSDENPTLSKEQVSELCLARAIASAKETSDLRAQEPLAKTKEGIPRIYNHVTGKYKNIYTYTKEVQGGLNKGVTELLAHYKIQLPSDLSTLPVIKDSTTLKRNAKKNQTTIVNIPTIPE